MTESQKSLDFEDILRNTNWKCASTSLVGSTVARNSYAFQDIDVYAVIEQPHRELYESVVQSGQEALREFERRGIVFMLETRRGPFKEYMAKGLKGQIHLIIETLTNMQRMPPVTLINWRNNSVHLQGRPLSSVLEDLTITDQDIYSNCVEWVNLLVEGLGRRKIPYKLWTGKKKMCLQHRWADIADSSQMFVFLRHSISTALTHYAIVKDCSFVASQDGLDGAARTLGSGWYDVWHTVWKILGGQEEHFDIEQLRPQEEALRSVVCDFLCVVKSHLCRMSSKAIERGQ